VEGIRKKDDLRAADLGVKGLDLGVKGLDLGVMGADFRSNYRLYYEKY